MSRYVSNLRRPRARNPVQDRRGCGRSAACLGMKSPSPFPRRRAMPRSAAFRHRRVADTQAWRARQRRGAAVYPVEVDGRIFDLMARFGGLEADKVDDKRALLPPSLRSSTSPAAFDFNL